MMSKYTVAAGYALCSVIAIVIIALSFGLYLAIFSIVLIPAIIMQVLAGIRAFKKHPEFVAWILLSGIAFLAFSLFRPDADLHGAFNGYSALLYHLGMAETKHVEPWAFSLEAALVLLLVQIFVNTYILRRAGRKMGN